MTFWRDGKIAKATVIGVFDFVLRVKPCRYRERLPVLPKHPLLLFNENAMHRSNLTSRSTKTQQGDMAPCPERLSQRNTRMERIRALPLC